MGKCRNIWKNIEKIEKIEKILENTGEIYNDMYIILTKIQKNEKMWTNEKKHRKIFKKYIENIQKKSEKYIKTKKNIKNIQNDTK